MGDHGPPVSISVRNFASSISISSREGPVMPQSLDTEYEGRTKMTAQSDESPFADQWLSKSELIKLTNRKNVSSHTVWDSSLVAVIAYALPARPT